MKQKKADARSSMSLPPWRCHRLWAPGFKLRKGKTPRRMMPKKAGICLSNAYAYVNCGLLGDRGRHHASDAIEESVSCSYSSCTSHRSPRQLSFRLLMPPTLHHRTTLLQIIGAAKFVPSTAPKGKGQDMEGRHRSTQNQLKIRHSLISP